MPFGTVVNTVEDTVAVILRIFDSAKCDIVFLAPPSLLSITGTYGTVEHAERFMQSGGVLRGITTVSLANVEEASRRMDIGLDLRHGDQSHELFMFVGDKQQSISAINTGVHNLTLNTPITAFWSEDPTYAEYLLASFETAWSDAVPAEERIKELLGQDQGSSNRTSPQYRV